jgi:hypothetical protein
MSDLGWRPRFSNVDMLVRAYDRYVSSAETDRLSIHRQPLRGGLARLLRG